MRIKRQASEKMKQNWRLAGLVSQPLGPQLNAHALPEREDYRMADGRWQMSRDQMREMINACECVPPGEVTNQHEMIDGDALVVFLEE